MWLNNDTIVTQNWLNRLIEYLEKFPKAAAIGPVSNGTGIIQHVDDFTVNEPTMKDVNEFGIQISSDNDGSVIEYHRIAGFCIVMKSELISKIGKLDERYGIGGYDDDDYCKRIRNAGYKILIAEDVFVYHKSGTSFSQLADPDFHLSFLIQKNRQKFLEKWVGVKQSNSSNYENPLVSIIMSTKDRDYIISRAIESVINQNYQNWELLIINDGGRDIKHLVKNFSDHRIKYFNLEKNFGKSYANNFGIDKSKGEVIAYLDDDDIWFENHLESAVRALLEFPSRQIVYTDYIKVRHAMDKLGVFNPFRKEVMQIQTARYDTFDQMNFIPNFCLVHKKEVFNTVEKYDESLRYYEDWDFIRRLSKKNYFVHVPKITGEYWIEQLAETRNIVALLDKKFNEINSYIKNKNKSESGTILKILHNADNMHKSSELKKAYQEYKKILKTDPDYVPALEGVADRKYTLHDFKESVGYWERLITLEPNNSYYYERAAECCLQLKNYSRAKEILEYSLTISDERKKYFMLQQCYRNLDNEKTSKFIQKKLSIFAENINFQDVEQLLLKLYNKSPFYRKLFILGYRFLKKISRV